MSPLNVLILEYIFRTLSPQPSSSDASAALQLPYELFAPIPTFLFVYVWLKLGMGIEMFHSDLNGSYYLWWGLLGETSNVFRGNSHSHVSLSLFSSSSSPCSPSSSSTESFAWLSHSPSFRFGELASRSLDEWKSKGSEPFWVILLDWCDIDVVWRYAIIF